MPESTLDRLELRLERLSVTFRFTYAFHAREVRFECDRGRGFERVFPETFSFHPDRHDPAELFLQLSDLADKPQLLDEAAVRRDTELLISRLVLTVPRYLEGLLDRLEVDDRFEPRRLDEVYSDIALLAQVMVRFTGRRQFKDHVGLRTSVFHMRKLLYRTLNQLVSRRVDWAYLEGYVRGQVDPVVTSDDLSEAGFFHALNRGPTDAVNRILVRLAERAFYRWLEDVCLDEENRAFELENSPFGSREDEVRAAVGVVGTDVGATLRGRELSPWLRRLGNRDCVRLLEKLEAWFLHQYDINRAAAMIQHADNVAKGVDDADRVLSWHRTSTYVACLALLAAPFAGAAVAYERAPRLFDALCALELLVANVVVCWFLFYRFLWKRDLTFFHASVPRIMAGIIVGYLPIFFIDEVWSLAERSWTTLAAIVAILGSTTLLYLYVEVRRRLGDTDVAFSRARQIFLLGVLQASGIGLIFTGLVGPFMVGRNWTAAGVAVPLEALRDGAPPFLGQLPVVVGVSPFYAFPSAIFVMAFMSFFIGTFLQLMWEDLPITEPL